MWTLGSAPTPAPRPHNYMPQKVPQIRGGVVSRHPGHCEWKKMKGSGQRVPEKVRVQYGRNRPQEGKGLRFSQRPPAQSAFLTHF